MLYEEGITGKDWRCLRRLRRTSSAPALRARYLNGAKFYIKLTSPAHSVRKGGPTVFRCDGAYMRDAMKCRGW
jgi:hypothetical protein